MKVIMRKCKVGYRGDCCCNCIYQLKLFCHPWNKKFGKGSWNKKCGYVCTIMEERKTDKKVGIYSDRKHGMCELHDRGEA